MAKLMVTVHQLRNYFWMIDPGYFNLKHAVKAILAILISLWLVRDGGTLTKVIAAVASGSSMQIVFARSLISRIARVVILDVAYFSALALGFTVRNYPGWTAIVLVILGFVVNYIRRFGLDHSMVPMMGWVLCFMATILPFTDPTQILVVAHGALIGFLVSGVVLIFVFPENYSRLFVSNTNLFFQSMAQGLREMRRYVLVVNESGNFTGLPFVTIKTMLERLLESNQTMQQNIVFDHDEKKISYLVMHQYALLNAYSLMIDVYHSLWVDKHRLSLPGKLALSYISKEFACLFAAITVGADYVVSADKATIQLPSLAKKLGKISLAEPELIMALLNLKLSFDLLNQHAVTLLRGVDAT